MGGKYPETWNDAVDVSFHTNTYIATHNININMVSTTSVRPGSVLALLRAIFVRAAVWSPETEQRWSPTKRTLLCTTERWEREKGEEAEETDKTRKI